MCRGEKELQSCETTVVIVADIYLGYPQRGTDRLQVHIVKIKQRECAAMVWSKLPQGVFQFVAALLEQYNQKGNDSSNLAYLNAAIKRLDALDFSDASPIATFRANVVTALSTSPATVGGIVRAAPAAVDTSVARTATVEGMQKKIERDIKLITLGQQAVVWVVSS